MAGTKERTEPGIPRGSGTISFVEEMLENREVELIGDVNDDAVYNLCRQLRCLYREDPDCGITIYIDSPGGPISSGLALYDTMRAITRKRRPDGSPRCPIRTICMGSACSMAATLLAAGTREERYVMPHGQVMIHDPLVPFLGHNTALELRQVSKSLMKMRKDMAKMLSEFTGKSVREILDKTRQDTYFTAEGAVAFGLADKIVDDLDMIRPF